MWKFAMRVLTSLFLALQLTTIVFGKYDDVWKFVNEYLIYREVIEFVDDCKPTDLSLCFKERVLRYLEEIPNNIDIGGGLKIKENHGGRVSRKRASIVLPTELSEKDDTMDKMILERLADVIRSYSIEYKVPEEIINDLGKFIEEGRKKKGDGGGGIRMRPMLVLLQIKAAALGAIALKFIGLVAFKALLVAKMAFTIATVIALKKLVESKPHSSTYEVHTHPHYDEHSSYDRSFHHHRL